MKKFTILSASLVFVLLIAGVLVAPDISAQSLSEGVQSARGEGVPVELFGDASIFTVIVNVLLFIIGALSTIMIIIGGLRYAISGGDSKAITAAKNTILYAIVGLVVAFVAFAAVNFVLGSLTGGGAGGTDV